MAFQLSTDFLDSLFGTSITQNMNIKNRNEGNFGKEKRDADALRTPISTGEQDLRLELDHLHSPGKQRFSVNCSSTRGSRQ
jgi:hypothetical protein